MFLLTDYLAISLNTIKVKNEDFMDFVWKNYALNVITLEL